MCDGSQSHQRLARAGGWSHPLGRKSTGRRACYLIPESDYMVGVGTMKGVPLPSRTAGRGWQPEMKLLQDTAQAETEGRKTPASPLLALACFPPVPPMDFNQRYVSKGAHKCSFLWHRAKQGTQERHSGIGLRASSWNTNQHMWPCKISFPVTSKAFSNSCKHF